MPEGESLEHEPLFLFILTPPFSGSTALAQMLNSGPDSMFLEERAEGQWLVPGLHDGDRWNPDMPVDWSSVRAVWQARIGLVEKLVGPMKLVIEKSPPHLVRADQLVREFPQHRLVALNRNPHANLSSMLYRHHPAETMREPERIEMLKKLSRAWITRSTWLKQWIEQYRIMSLTYETFCEDPENALKKIAELLPFDAGFDPDRPVRVKDYPAQGIVNQNPRQVERLSKDERAVISEQLAEHEALVESFGYSVEWD
ncbi:MAG: sulfotransferase [Verrucomicrobiota bacterium]